MSWRKWLVRIIVVLPLGLLSAGWVLYERWTDAAVLRQQIIERLETEFVNVNVNVKSARLRLFGNLTAFEIRLSRRDNLDNQDFAYVPTTVLYHDKEQLLSGELNVRKVELRQPRLRLVRRPDGSWNVAGILREPDLARRMPTLVVRDGTIVLIDQTTSAGTGPLEIKQVHLTLVNDPLPVLTFEGNGNTDLLGPVRISGRAERNSGALRLSIHAKQVPLGTRLLRLVANYYPEAAKTVDELKGAASVSATIGYAPKDKSPLQYNVTAKLTNSTLRSPALPWTLQQFNASLQLINGTIPYAKFEANAGGAKLDGSLHHLRLAALNETLSLESCCQASEQLHLTAQHLDVNESLLRCWQETLQPYRDEFSPSGRMTVRYLFKRMDSSRWQKRWTLQAELMQASYVDFPRPVENVRGTVEVVMNGGRQSESTNLEGSGAASTPDDFSQLVRVDLEGTAGGSPVRLTGTTRGPSGTSKLDLKLEGQNLRIDDALKKALRVLSPDTLRVAESFHPTGLIDYDVMILRQLGSKDTTHQSVLRMHDGTVKYDELPLPLTDVSGTLLLFPDHWEFRQFVGRYKDGGIIRASGRSHPGSSHQTVTRTTTPYLSDAAARREADGGPPKDRVSVTIEGERIPLDKDFEKALSSGRAALGEAWKTFAITGRMNFVAVIDDLPDKPRDIDVTVAIGGCRAKPSFFQYELADVSARIRYASDSVFISDFRGRHGNARLLIDKGTVLLKENGGYWAKLDKLRATPLTFDDDFLDALPPVLRNGCQGLELKDPVRAETVLVIDQAAEAGSDPTIYWKSLVHLDRSTVQAGVEMKNVTGAVTCEGLYKNGQLRDVIGRLDLTGAEVLDQPLRSLRARFAVSKDAPDVLQVWDLNAQLFDGAVGGQASIELGSIFRYALYLKASQISLEAFGRHNLGKDADLRGMAQAALYLEGKGKGIEGLRGSGNVDVPDGKMAKLPFLLDLLKWLGLRVPDRTAFEQAHVTFEVDGPRAKITKLDLYGNAISVRGTGGVNLDGSALDLDLNVDWGRLSQLLPAGVDRITRGISNQLLKIKAKGSISDFQFEKRFVPIVTEPLQRMLKSGKDS